MPTPRIWQRRATEAFYAACADRPDFLVSATPGAGKTTFALDLAASLLDQGLVQRVGVIVPTDALREQWVECANKIGLGFKPVHEPEDYDKTGYNGFVATYQQLLNAGSNLARRALRRKTLVVLDEIHHAGDNRSWGDALQNAVENATYRVALTGTPWRRDTRSPIPFVKYSSEGKVLVDYAYEYGEAVADEVCRRIEFHAYDGEARWLDRGRAAREQLPTNGISAQYTARIGADMDEDDVSAALETLYEPKYQWMPEMLAQANTMLGELRREVPDAGGLVIAERQWQAHGYATLLERITGMKPPVVVSDPATDPDGAIAKEMINRFRKGNDPWIVAVKMISEGVDINRLAVGVYASKTQTPLFFRQVVGRFVRTRPNEEFNARLLMPAVPQLLQHAREIEDELRHQLDVVTEQDEKEKKTRVSTGQMELDFREPLSTSEPIFDRAILGGQESNAREIAEAEAYCRTTGVPVRFAAALVPLMRQRLAFPELVTPAPSAPPMARHKREKLLRGECTSLANRLAKRVDREPQEINADLLRAGFPRRPTASVEELEAIKATLLDWLAQV